MKFKTTIFLLVFCQTIHSQDNISSKDNSTKLHKVNCKYCGIYQGLLNIKTDNSYANIVVTLSLQNDSTFKCNVSGIFGSCTSSSFSSSGKWLYDNNLLYFMPFNNGSCEGFILESVFKDKETLVEIEKKEKYYKMGYTEYLKAPLNDNININFTYDCFESYWKNRPIKKIILK